MSSIVCRSVTLLDNVIFDQTRSPELLLGVVASAEHEPIMGV